MTTRHPEPRRKISLGLLVLAAVLLALPACGDGSKTPPSFILISVDTARADHLGLYGHAREASPYLDSLGLKAILFEEATTVSGNTLISHASMLTGLYPLAHGTTHVDEGTALHPALRTLAEDFADQGYCTAGFAAHGDWLTPGFGMDQGFQVFSSAYRDADAVLKEAMEWLKQREEGQPFFLFIHLFDVHSEGRDMGDRPYEAPPPFKGRFTGDYTGRLEPWSDQPYKGSDFLKAVMAGVDSITPEELDYLRGQYDEGLAYTDDRLGRFMIDAARLENLFLIVTADHGEEFMEHGGLLHGAPYEEIVRVPLLIVPPPEEAQLLGAPRRFREPVCLVDLRPTLCALARLPRPEACQGRNLVPWLTHETEGLPEKPVPLFPGALRYEGFKLVVREQGLELYDLKADPAEQTNLAGLARHQKRIHGMHQELVEQMKNCRALREAYLASYSGEEGGPPELDAEASERLRALGY